MARAETLQVEVAYCADPDKVDLQTLQVQAGTTLAQAVALSGVLTRHGLDANGLRMGIWSRVSEPATLLRERDRIEIYRPLLVDPKEARRLRYKKQKPPKPTKPA